MNGTGSTTFEPNGSATRAMVVTMLWRLAGEPETDYALNFTDVPEDIWYTEAVRWAASEGIVTGYDEKTFAPENLVTREQLASILYRYAQSESAADGELSAFTDAGDVSDWALDAMRWAVGTGILNGMGEGTLNPQGNATRAQVAAMFGRFVKRTA
jgi:hypothetical protein